MKQSKYHYDADAIRSKPREAWVVNGAVVSATGVSNVRYKRQIELSTTLSEEEKREAFKALDQMLADVSKVSGRAKELRDRGFYFLKYHPNGSKPADVWDIMPEDTQKRESHYAPYPVDLCRIPILATCPGDGVVLDPFYGTGTTLLAARDLGRQSIGIDISSHYLEIAEDRCATLL